MAAADWTGRRVRSDALGQSGSCSGDSELRHMKDSCQLDMGAVAERFSKVNWGQGGCDGKGKLDVEDWENKRTSQGKSEHTASGRGMAVTSVPAATLILEILPTRALWS